MYVREANAKDFARVQSAIVFIIIIIIVDGQSKN
jgi:hypothetical protein